MEHSGVKTDRVEHVV